MRAKSTRAKPAAEVTTAIAPDKDKIIKSRAICEWKTVGRQKTVSKSKSNPIYTVDDIPVPHSPGKLPQGSKVRFSLPADFDVVEKVIKGCEELKKTEMSKADALIVFSRSGRIPAGQLMSKEIEGIKNVSSVPVAEIFSSAELARITGETWKCITWQPVVLH